MLALGVKYYKLSPLCPFQNLDEQFELLWKNKKRKKKEDSTLHVTKHGSYFDIKH